MLRVRLVLSAFKGTVLSVLAELRTRNVLWPVITALVVVIGVLGGLALNEQNPSPAPKHHPPVAIVIPTPKTTPSHGPTTGPHPNPTPLPTPKPKPTPTPKPTPKPTPVTPPPCNPRLTICPPPVSKTVPPASVAVQHGNTLFGLAQKYYGNGNEWPAIWQANMKTVANPNVIFAGQKLVIPSTGTTFDPQEPDGAVTVTVHAGDTLASIAQQQLGNANLWPTLWHFNQAQVPNPSLIFVGQVLKI